MRLKCSIIWVENIGTEVKNYEHTSKDWQCMMCRKFGCIFYMWGPWEKGYFCVQDANEQQREIDSIYMGMRG